MIPFRVRSYYSLQQGVASPATLCRRARELGYQALAMTDRDNLYGLWEFLRACRTEGLVPVVGAEISEPESGKVATFLVKDQTGYRNLCTLLSHRHLHRKFRLEEEVPGRAAGLVILCPDLALLQLFNHHGLEAVADLGPRPTERGRALRLWAGKNGRPAVASADSDLLCPQDGQLFALVQAIRHKTSLGSVQHRRVDDQAECLAGPQEYGRRFAVWPEVVPATDRLAAACTFRGPEFGVVMPPWRGGQGRNPVPVLREKAYRGARRRYGDDLGEPVIERLEHELRVIEEMGFSSYFLVVRDIVHCRQPDGTRRKSRICGRGSGAASLVAYCLDITNVCPIKYNLYFERFLNPGRSDPPDIDIDFSWDERDAVLERVLRDFSGHAAMVCNHVFYKPRMAIRETARAFGLPGYEISQVTRRIPWISGTGAGLEQSLQALPSFKGMELSQPWPEILELAGRLVGLPRYLSVHPGGVVITPGPITDYVPVQRASKGVTIIQWEKDGAEEAGLVKIDLLGNRSLGVIRDCIEAVNASGGDIDELTWQPEDDPATKLMVANGGTMGCFYIESPAMRLLEKKAGTGDFEQLVIQSSIIRPAANEFVREYVRRLHGGAWLPVCPLVGDVLDETFGLMVYQEDVSRVAVAVAGFSHSEADGLRKVMSKKDKAARLVNYRRMFFKGCAARGVDDEETESMWKMMMSFDGYSFCKPHSASYARVSFQAAYLKRHHPAEFMAAVISNRGGYYSTFAYVSEAKRLGLVISHPDVRRSRLRWSGSGRELLVGLQAVHGLSAGFVKRLLEARKEKPFEEVVDFFTRTLPADDEARGLIHAGALDGLQSPVNRTVLLWQWACFQRLDHERRGRSLFAVKLPAPPPLPAPDMKTTLRREYRVLGFLCRYHPLQFIPQQDRAVKKVVELRRCVGQRVQVAGWLLTGKLVSTRTGEVMEFLTFEDDTGQLETVFFPRVYRAYANILQAGRGYLLTGLVEEDYGALTLTVEKVRFAGGE
jgi:DNA-directed DNA polymerase III PolC